MYTLVPRRYQTSKWLARVPASAAFNFKDGTSIRSLLELKQALLTLPEEVILYHTNSDRHDLASWVRFSIGDSSLADLLQKQTHRWGLIVALERGQMRTLNLPSYLANRWLAPTTVPFVFQSGETVRSLSELKVALQSISDATFDFHNQRSPNDISLWVGDAIGDYDLAEMLAEASNRLHLHNLVEDHLTMLADAS